MEEYLDICDSDGNLTGQKVTKKEAHDKGLWHRSVHVWFVNSKKEVLIQKRSPFIDNHPNEWDISCAGHVSAGEDYLTSAVREVKEELGIEVKPGDLSLIGTLKRTSKIEGYIDNEVNPIYVVKVDLKLGDIIKQDEEVSEVKFVYYKELKKIIENNDPTFCSHPEEYKILFNYLYNLNYEK